jgi:release factor glutamine methyltransferase
MVKPSPRTVVDFIRVTEQHLTKKGFDNPRLEAELLLGHLLGLNRVNLYLQFDRPLRPDEIGQFRSALRRRLNHEPLQWIIGETEFFDIRLSVRSGVFIPRPETEILAEITCKQLSDLEEQSRRNRGNSPKQIRILDIGTGSGAIALALAAKIPELIVHGCDISPVALELAHNNAANLHLDDRVSFERWDVMDFRIPAHFEEPYHWITMNPPYVPSGEWDSLPPEVQAEPKSALDGGPDGLDFYRRLCELLPDILMDKGGISLEVGIGQADAVSGLYAGAFQLVERTADYGGIDRVVCCIGYERTEVSEG